MLSGSMRKTLEALEEYEGMIYAGTTSGEVMASGGTRSTLYSAVKKGWANPYNHDYTYSSDGADSKVERYYITEEGTAVLEKDILHGQLAETLVALQKLDGF